MNKLVAAAVALPAALAALSGCASYDDYGYGSVGVGYNSYSGYPGYYRPYGGYYGGPFGYYDAYYDNFYGPIYGGFWHSDGFFYYQSYYGGPWYCDYNRHFRRDRFQGGVPGRFPDYRSEDVRRSWSDRGGIVGNMVRDIDNRRDGQDGQGQSQGQLAQGQSPQGEPAPRSRPAPPPAQRRRDSWSQADDVAGGRSSSAASSSPPPSSRPPPSLRSGGIAGAIAGRGRGKE